MTHWLAGKRQGTRSRGRTGVLLLIFAACGTVSAAGQTVGGTLAPAEPPPRVRPAPTKRLDFRLSVHEAFDQTRASDSAFPVLDPYLRRNSGFSAANAALNFASTTRGVTFGAVGAANLRHFTRTPDILRSDVYGAVNVTAQLGQRVVGRASQRISYSPYYSLGDLLGDDEAEPDDVLQPDHSIVRLATSRSRTSTGVAWTAAQRTTVNAGYVLDVVDSGARSALTQGGNFGMRRRLTQYADLRLGYGYRRSQVGSVAETFETHDLNTGFGYGRPLSVSRRTFVSFNTGASVVIRQSRGFFLTGNAALTHQVGRSWQTGLTYRRSVSAFAGFSDPYLVDGITGRLGGQLTRRLGMSLSASYARGRVAVDVNNGFTSASGRARVSYLVNRYLPLFGEYVYFHSRFERATGTIAGFPLFVTRHGLRVGVAYTVPLIGERPGR